MVIEGVARYRPGLNRDAPLLGRLLLALDGALRLDIAVAFATMSGTSRLLRAGLPRTSRVVVGLGFGLSDPAALEQMDSSGVSVRCVADSADLASSQYHPKLYLVSRVRELVVLSGSNNLTAGGLVSNVEQYEELRFPDPSAYSDEQRSRFEALWDHGHSLADLRRSGDWQEYRARARDRRVLEREDRRRLVRLHASTGRMLAHLTGRDSRRSGGYIGITHPEWWQLQLHLRDQADRALFWRRNTAKFQALHNGGYFFHLVKHPSGEEPLRAIEGFSVYPGVYETAPAEELWRAYGFLLGVERLSQLYDRLGVEPGRALGVIHLEGLTQLERPVTLDELRSSGVPFAPNIVSGRSLSLEEIAIILELGGIGTSDAAQLAAESPTRYGSTDISVMRPRRYPRDTDNAPAVT